MVSELFEHVVIVDAVLALSYVSKRTGFGGLRLTSDSQDSARTRL